MNTTIQRRSTRLRKPLLMRANEQYCLDFGQKNIDPIRCKICGMMYVVGEESDEKQHAKYHAEFDDGVRWVAKCERAVKYFDNASRIVAISATDPKPILDLVNKLLKMSDGDMSAGDDVAKLLSKDNTIFLVHVTATNHMVGYICAELIKEAFCLVNYELSALGSDPVPAECGVSSLWVHPKYRRNKIGTWLVDVARANIKRERIVSRTRVAVSDPTEIAVPFFDKFLLHKRPVKVYTQQ